MIARLGHRVRSWLRQIDLLHPSCRNDAANRRWRIPRIVWIGGRSILLSSTLVTALLLGIEQIGGLEPLELFAFDHLTRMQRDRGPDPRLLVVTITEPDLHRWGWPLSDQTLADLLQQLQQHQPKVIGLDLYRNLSHPPGQADLAVQLQAENLIAIHNAGTDPERKEVPPPPGVEQARVGFNDLVSDPDGVLRRGLLFVGRPEQPDQAYYSFGLQLSLAYLGEQAIPFRYDDQTLQIGRTRFPVLERKSGGYQTIDARGYQILLHYRSGQRIARQVSLDRVLSGRFDPDWVRGKVVLIGTTAASLKDLFYTPYSAGQQDEFMMPGVIIHAQITSQILASVLGDEPLWRFWPQWGETLWLWGWTMVGGLIAWRFKHPLALGSAVGIGIGIIVGTGWLLFQQVTWIPIMEPALGFVAATGLVMAHKLLYSTSRDALTGLPNRESFLRYLRRSLLQTQAQQSLLSVLFLDLDRFKLINESWGHQMGDRVLLLTVDRLQTVVPRSARLARMGGDEFAIAWQPGEVDDVATLADQLQEALTIPIQLNHREVSTPVSIGIALTQRGHDHKPEDLLRDAHTAMYRAKALGKARHEVFASGMLVEAVNRLNLENDLRRGIQNQEFLLHYQPIIDLQTGYIRGFEALVRWQHPEQGFVSPSTFIPVAEETGLIVPLGQWIFQAACRQVRQWQQQFPQHPPLMMSINFSSRQLEQPNLVEQLEQTLKETGIDGSSIKVEVTESMVMGDVEAAIDLMLRLKSLHLKLGIDDFGTGYSSLSYLHRFPMDTLKIDKSFVSRMEKSSEDYEIVHTIINLGHNLGMDVIAEGIETAEQRQALQELHCELGQGYFFSRPLSEEAATALLADNRQW